jgi:hypothetical protein
MMDINLSRICQDSEVFTNIDSNRFINSFESKTLLSTIRMLGDTNSFIHKNFAFIILFNDCELIDSDRIGSLNRKRKIFIVFDEYAKLPLGLLKDDSNIVFHAYLSFSAKNRPFPNLFHFPLGCNGFVPERNYVPMKRRKLNVFFSGNLHAGRTKLYQSLSNVSLLPLPILVRIQRLLQIRFDNKFPASYIRFTKRFSSGFSFDDYADYLSESKIILSPPGINNPECFRHYEGLRAGCVVLTERLPIKPHYDGSPIIEVGKWSNGFRIINELLMDQDRLEALGKQSFDWYQAKLRPNALARYISENVQSLFHQTVH